MIVTHFYIVGTVNGVEGPERDIQPPAAARRSNGKTDLPRMKLENASSQKMKNCKLHRQIEK